MSGWGLTTFYDSRQDQGLWSSFVLSFGLLRFYSGVKIDDVEDHFGISTMKTGNDGVWDHKV